MANCANDDLLGRHEAKKEYAREAEAAAADRGWAPVPATNGAADESLEAVVAM